VKPFDPRLLRYSRSSRGFIFTLVLIAVIGAVATIGQALLLVDLICKFFQQKRTFSSLAHEVIALTGVFIARALLAYLNDRLSARASSRMRNELRTEVMKKSLSNGGSDTQSLGTAGLAVLVTKGINNLDGYFAKFLPQLFIAVVVPIAVGVSIALRDWKSGAIILFTLPLIPIFGILIGRFTASATEKKWKTLGLLGGYFLDLLSGLSTLKVYGREKLQAQRLREVGEKYRKETMQVLRISFLTSLALELVATLSVALLAVTIGLRLVNGSMPLNVGLFVLVLAPEVYWPIRQVSAYFHSATDGLAAFDQLFTILEKPDSKGVERITSFSSISWGEIRVSFPGRSEVVIPEGKIEPGRIHALVGPSGSGKSTLASVLLGFIKPTAGEVRVHTDSGVHRLEDLDIKAWRELIAWQPQEPKYPIGSVAEILRHAAPSATNEKLIDALDEVDLKISDLPNGLETELGTIRQKLSIGQMRKIALARALLKASVLVILDEPTASVDDISEATIARLLEKRAKSGTSILVISHRELLIGTSASVTVLGASR
jgi:ATP-binding cassette, subfamily C, bacterial CydCD